MLYMCNLAAVNDLSVSAVTMMTMLEFLPWPPETVSGRITLNYHVFFLSVDLSLGVSVCGVSERTERPLPRLQDSQQPDPDRAQDNRHGSDGGGIALKRATQESLVE